MEGATGCEDLQVDGPVAAEAAVEGRSKLPGDGPEEARHNHVAAVHRRDEGACSQDEVARMRPDGAAIAGHKHRIAEEARHDRHVHTGLVLVQMPESAPRRE